MLAEAYEDVQTSLNPTTNLETIADFLNQNQVWSGSPVRGSGGWYVNNSEVTNDDAEGGYSGINVKMVPGDEGLTAHCRSTGPAVFSWPVRAQDVERYMQSKNSNL